MQVQKVNNEPSFKMRKIVVNDNVANLGKNVPRAIAQALSEAYEMGDGTTDLFFHTKRSRQGFWSKTLVITIKKDSENARKGIRSMFNPPPSSISVPFRPYPKSSWSKIDKSYILEAIKTALRKSAKKIEATKIIRRINTPHTIKNKQ